MNESRNLRQEMKLKQKWTFLTDILDENKKDTDEKISTLSESIEKNKSDILQELSVMNDSIKLLNENVQKLQVVLDENKTLSQENTEKVYNSVTESGSSLKELIQAMVDKIKLSEEAGLEREKQLKGTLLTKNAIITAGIESIKSLLSESNEELKNQIPESINSIITKLEQIDNNELEREKQFEEILMTKNNIIARGIDEIRSLVQLLAVNELMDEIDI